MKVMILDHPRPYVETHANDVANAPLSASLNTGYAAAVAELAGCEVEYANFYDTSASNTEMAHAIRMATPDVLLIHWVYTWDNCSAVKDLIASAKLMRPDMLVLAFGLFPTLCTQELLNTPGLDGILPGEFEFALFDQLTTLMKNTGHLTDIPFPKDLGKTANLTHMNVAASRGCYGNCSFCFIPPYYGNSSWRGRQPDQVLAEIDTRRQSRSINQVYFVDPNFFGPGQQGQERAIQIAEGLAERGITFGLEARVNDIQRDTIQHLKRCGLESIFLGIESASPNVLKRMRKGITPEQSSLAVRILQDYGVFINVGFLMFESESTLKDLRINYDFLESHELLTIPSITANVLYHNQIVIKGTPAYRKLDQANRLLKSPETPYEAEVIYADPAVCAVQKKIGQRARSYFRKFQHGSVEVDHAAINNQLKEYFLELLERPI